MTTMNATTRTLSTDGATITYDVRGELPTADGRPPLVMIGQPMTAAGFTALASHFSDRTVVTYDPRGLGRSTRGDGRTDQDPTVQAQDLHALVEELGAGPVDVFASSGGAVTALAWVTAYPQDIATLVAHEPPMIRVLPDADQADRAFRSVQEAYRAKGWGAGMAQFVAMTMWQGEITDEFLARPPADPAQFGMPTEDDGSRGDPLLSGAGDAVSGYRPDFEAIRAAPTRVVIAVGVESQGTFTDRTSRATAQALGQEVTVFPSHHGGFLGDELGQRGEPEAFAARLHEVLDH
jgi:pimeloyl-ACP methyl ester carboxylesterase